MLFSTMAGELWGLQSKPLQRMGPAQPWLLRAVSSQGLDISEHGEFTASLDTCSHVWPLSQGRKNMGISLSVTSIHHLFSHGWEESVSAFPTPRSQAAEASSEAFPKSEFLPEFGLENTVSYCLQESIRDLRRTIALVITSTTLPKLGRKSGHSCHSLLPSGVWTSTD